MLCVQAMRQSQQATNGIQLIIKMNLNVAVAGQSSSGGSDVTTASLGNQSTTPLSQRRTALHYDSESSTSNAAVGGDCTKTTSGDGRCSTPGAAADDILPPVSTLFADRECHNSDVATKSWPDQILSTITTTKQAFVPQLSVAQATAGQTASQKPPAARKRPPRPRKPSKRSRANRNQNHQQQQQQQNGLLIMQKLLGSMTSLLRRDVAPLMTSFPVVTCSQRSPTVQSLPLSMFCAGAVGRQMPCGPLARSSLLPPAATGGSLMAGAVRGPVVRPVVWPGVVAGGNTPGRRAPLTASTSAPLLAGSRSSRQKMSSSGAVAARGVARTEQPVNRLELLTVAALRDECRRRRLPTGGPKPNLIRRLQQNNVHASFNCAGTSSYVQTSMSTTLVPPSAAPRQLVAPPAGALSSAPKSSLPVTATTPNEARASLSQSQAIVARILSIRAAQRQRRAELAAAANSTASPPSAAAAVVASSCTTSTAVAGSVPVTAGPSPRAPTSDVLTAIARTMCASVAATLPQFNQTANVQLPAALTGNKSSSANQMNATSPVSHMTALTADKQTALGQNLGQKGQRGHCLEEQWRLPDMGQPVCRQQELGQDESVQGQNVGQSEDVWRLGDAESQETLCRQQQMLIYELRRQLEQSRRALIEAQAGELKMAAEPPRRPRTSGDLATSPVAQPSADVRPNLPISVGARPGSLHPIDVVPAVTCTSFSLQHQSRLTSSSVPRQQQQQLTEQQETVTDDSLSLSHRLADPRHDIKLGVQPARQMLVVLCFSLTSATYTVTTALSLSSFGLPRRPLFLPLLLLQGGPKKWVFCSEVNSFTKY